MNICFSPSPRRGPPGNGRSFRRWQCHVDLDVRSRDQVLDEYNALKGTERNSPMSSMVLPGPALASSMTASLV
jgi:hypothetical protein